MARAFAEITFTPSVLATQEQQGSASHYARFLTPDAAPGDRLGPEEAAFIAERDGFYQATVSATGWPYVQFRGGPPGFLKVLDAKTIAYADFRGNRQYLSAGNILDNDRISLILMDYPNRRRLKVWGRARRVEGADDPTLVEQLKHPGYRAIPERAIVITIEALDWNCPSYITRRMTVEELEPMIAPLRSEIERLTAENAALRAEKAEKS